MTISAGTRLGPYEMLGALGAGGMGEVWRARDTRLGREVAVKLLPAEFAQDAQRRERFEQEARAVAALNHPNILALYDIGNEEGMAYMVTELVPGETLRGASFPLRKGLEIAAQIADGLAAAHAAGVTHRDLKPDNVMVTSDGRAKILDFGLAKVSRKLAADEATVKVTEPGAVMGTVGYMSPEQVRGAEIDPRSDIFSFGVVLHEMLSGKRAFEGASAIEAMNAILNNDPPELAETVPSAVRDIVSHCLEKRPEQRFQSARDLAFALRAVGGRSGSSPVMPPVAAAPPPPRRAPLWIAPALLLAGVLIGGVAALRWSGAAENRLDPIQLTRFASEPEAEAFSAFSPDEHSVAYMRWGGGFGQVVVQSLDAPDSVVLVSSPNLFSPQPPVWTADGTRVCYVWSLDLLCVSAAGGAPRPLMAGVLSAAFTRDGKSLVFIRAENARPRLFASTPPGAEPKPIDGVTLPGGANVLALAPDESKLLVVDTRAGAGWLVPYPRGVPQRLASPGNAQVLSGRWFPDSRHVALAESSDLRFRLVIADTQSPARRLVVPATGGIVSATVSPGGNRILYSTGPWEGNIIEYSPNGKQVRALVASSNRDGDPSWSPGGDRFVYTVASPGRSTTYLWTRGADGSGAMLLAATPASRPRYAPDARRIAYIAGFAADGIDTISATGGRPVRIVSAAGVQNLCWSSDGEWVWYQQGGKLWRAPSQGGGQAMAVQDQADTLVDYSPDGRWIAYQSKSGLNLIAPDGKQGHVLTGAPDYGNVGQFGEGGSVLYMLRNNRRSVDALDVATGNVRRTIDFEVARADEITSFSFHPDGKRVLLQTGGLRYDLWMAEGFAQPAHGLMSWFRHWETQ